MRHAVRIGRARKPELGPKAIDIERPPRSKYAGSPILPLELSARLASVHVFQCGRRLGSFGKIHFLWCHDVALTNWWAVPTLRLGCQCVALVEWWTGFTLQLSENGGRRPPYAPRPRGAVLPAVVRVGAQASNVTARELIGDFQEFAGRSTVIQPPPSREREWGTRLRLVPCGAPVGNRRHTFQGQVARACNGQTSCDTA